MKNIEKYIDHAHIINVKPAKVPALLKNKILHNFRNMMKMKERGINLFFTDIDNIKKQMLEELLVAKK